MLLFLALRCQFIGGVLGTQGRQEGPRVRALPGQGACEPSGLVREPPSGKGEERTQMRGAG